MFQGQILLCKIVSNRFRELRVSHFDDVKLKQWMVLLKWGILLSLCALIPWLSFMRCLQKLDGQTFMQEDLASPNGLVSLQSFETSMSMLLTEFW